MTTFFISDTHFNHSKILQFGRKQFSSVEEMNSIMVENWNKVVKPTDIVWHLGDVVMEPQGEKDFEILGKLNGDKRLICGNHDSDFKIKEYQKYFTKIFGCYDFGPRYSNRDCKFILSHIPVHPIQFNRCQYNIHGHLHDELVDDPRYISVCVEKTNYTPISFEEIMEKINA